MAKIFYKMKTKLLFLFLILFQLGNSQERTCGMDHHMETIMADPIQRAQFLERQSLVRAEYEKIVAQQANQGKLASPNVTLQIPVAVHYPEVATNASETLKSCLRNLAQSQINVINADYNATNADISNWTSASAFYPGVNVGDLDVEFVIATQNHPAGSGLINGQVAVTFGTAFLNGADQDFTWSGYMNFVIRDLGPGLLGYSPLNGSPAAGHTVVMNKFCFGTTGNGCSGYFPQAPFNKGRTVTHELGHFFSLNHIFKYADPNSFYSCSGPDSDGIADTPKQALSTYGCAFAGEFDACVPGEKVLSMNYMDYSDDACMYMFTVGQKNAMQAYLNVISSQFNQNVLSTEVAAVRSNFSVYPNPNKGTFNIELKDLVENYSIEVFDNSGRIVFEKQYNQNNSLSQEISLDAVSSGVYFVTIKSNDVLTTKKIIIE